MQRDLAGLRGETTVATVCVDLGSVRGIQFLSKISQGVVMYFTP